MKRSLERVVVEEGVWKPLVVTALAVCIAMVLLVAAYGKMFYPTEDLRILDIWVSVFEVVLLANLILYRYRGEMWLIASFVFACWGGYSLFWYRAELPCSCMGEALKLPDGLSFFMNIVFYGVSIGMARWLGIPWRLWLSGFCIAILLTLSGWMIAQAIFNQVTKDDDLAAISGSGNTSLCCVSALNRCPKARTATIHPVMVRSKMTAT